MQEILFRKSWQEKLIMVMSVAAINPLALQVELLNKTDHCFQLIASSADLFITLKQWVLVLTNNRQQEF